MNPNGFVKLPLKGEGIRMEKGYQRFKKKVSSSGDLILEAWKHYTEW